MMATTVSDALDGLADRLNCVPTESGLEDLIARLTREGLISMREAAQMYARNTHKSTPTRHAQRGVKLADGTLLRLESIRVSGRICTSRAAVLRFFARQSGAAPVTMPAPPTPAQRRRAADRASAELDALLGGQ